MITTIVLAAGEASRMGQPKQLMQLDGKSLVQRAVQTAQTVSDEIIVVTGAYADQIQENLSSEKVHFVHNPQWQTGMGSSIRAGIQQIMSVTPLPNAIIVMLCDQPLASPSLLEQLVTAYRHLGKTLVASVYHNTAGVPALFGEALFPELLQLDGRAGAKSIITRYASQIASVDFPEGIYDVDTPNDFARIKERLKGL
ncbi:nucleotidyltransferase family protein [Tunicatimonas pelagia]|uniref:nucleotidyltransferase family protein n=1 Tax=Tunicatimonas pelagia TaxID=931531 RepID=UPI002666047D|nr:nucleotidyltransferase family protein [Tunicatimonas pelagia]WKN46133.1 nucleotidyltransferase family protein [Tunicatimonas pelagia]